MKMLNGKHEAFPEIHYRTQSEWNASFLLTVRLLMVIAVDPGAVSF